MDNKFTIKDEEELLRLLSFPSCIDKYGRLTTTAFDLYHKDEDFVSLVRLCFSSKEDALALGQKIKKWPTKGDVFMGLAHLVALKIRKISPAQLRLVSKYTEQNKAHAGISYYDKDGVLFVNTSEVKGKPTPAWIIPLQQQLCRISEVEMLRD